MQLLKFGSTKKAPKKYTNQNFLESLASIGGGTFDSVKKDLIKPIGSDVAEQISGAPKKQEGSRGGDLSAGHELDLEQIKHGAEQITEMGREFAQEIIHAGKIARTEDSQEIAVKMQEILIEIKQLANSSAELKSQVEVITVEQATQKPGIYHVNFLEQMLSFIREARMNVEDSLAWFGALKSKKNARQYSSMAKKHGTSFTLSNERTVATQSG
jgi:hypothetical protein